MGARKRAAGSLLNALDAAGERLTGRTGRANLLNLAGQNSILLESLANKISNDSAHLAKHAESLGSLNRESFRAFAQAIGIIEIQKSSYIPGI